MSNQKPHDSSKSNGSFFPYKPGTTFIPTKILKHPRVSGYEKAVLGVIASFGSDSFPSIDKLVELTGFGRTTVNKALRLLAMRRVLGWNRTGSSNEFWPQPESEWDLDAANWTEAGIVASRPSTVEPEEDSMAATRPSDGRREIPKSNISGSDGRQAATNKKEKKHPIKKAPDSGTVENSGRANFSKNGTETGPQKSPQADEEWEEGSSTGCGQSANKFEERGDQIDRSPSEDDTNCAGLTGGAEDDDSNDSEGFEHWRAESFEARWGEIDRLRTAYQKELREEHPDWTQDQLEDEIDARHPY